MVKKIIVRIIVYILCIIIPAIFMYCIIAFLTWNIYWASEDGFWPTILRLIHLGICTYTSISMWMYLKEQINDGNK